MLRITRQNWWSGRTRIKDRPLDDALISICKAQPPKRYLEIGTREGGSLLAVLEHSEPRPELVICCDTWGPVHGGTARGSHDHIVELLEEKGIDIDDLRFLDGDSAELVPTIRLRNFDLVLVDGDHDPGPAKKDLANAWPLVKPGGFLVFDDTNNAKLGRIVVKWSQRPDAKIIWASGRRPGCTVLKKLLVETEGEAT